MDTNVTARNGAIIKVGDIIETVQETKFEVICILGNFSIRDKDGNLFALEPYMSPNIWIIGEVEQPIII